jgi:hypothetical protein
MVVMLVVLFWALWAYICGMVAAYKGRSPVRWAIAGVCFGMFAVIAACLVKQVRPATADEPLYRAAA